MTNKTYHKIKYNFFYETYPNKLPVSPKAISRHGKLALGFPIPSCLIFTAHCPVRPAHYRW